MIKYFDINAPGHSIKCKLYCHNPRSFESLILFGHGFGGHKDNKAAERFATTTLSKHKNTAVLTFDWPCHGDDVKKKLVLADCSTYIDLIRKYASEQFGDPKLYVYATSFGGYLFLKYIQERDDPFVKIALRCPAVPMYQVLTQSIMQSEEADKLEKGKEVLVGFDRKIRVNPQFLADLRETDITQMDYIDHCERILILHGTKDEIVPFDAVREFADKQLMEFTPIENADHRFRDPVTMDLAIKYILEFFTL